MADGAYCCKAFLGGASMGETGLSVKKKLIEIDDDLALCGVAPAPEEGCQDKDIGFRLLLLMASMV